MGMTLTQFSNLLNLMTQAETRLKFYHYGWRSDINIEPQNNYNPEGSTGRLYPALHLDIPDYLTYQEEPQPNGVQQKARINLYFDTLQGYNNDGSKNVESMLEQMTGLLKISEDFMSNLVVMFSHYGTGAIDGNVTFTPRANLHNANLITIEVAFDMLLAAECTDVAYQVDVNDFPVSLDIEDLERVIGTPPTRCQTIVSGLTQDDLLYCILPLYDFSDVATLAALSAQQLIDLGAYLLPLYDFSDPNIQALLTAQQHIDLTTYLLPLVDFSDVNIQALLTVQQKEDLITFLLPLVDFSDPNIQALLTPTQEADLITLLCTPSAPTVNYSMLFDGTNEDFVCTSSVVNNLTGFTPFTISCWFMTTNIAASQILFAKTLGGGQGISMGTTATTIFINVRGSILDAAFRRATISLSNNVWYHMCVTSDGTGNANGFKIYLNAVFLAGLATSNNFSTTMATSSAITLGSNAGGTFRTGAQSITRYWKREFTAADVLLDYNVRDLVNDPLYPTDLIFGFNPNQDSVFANGVWNVPNESTLDPNNGSGSRNMEEADRVLISVQPFP